MNDRKRNLTAKIIAIAGSAVCGTYVAVFAGIKSIFLIPVLAWLAGMFGYFAFTGIGIGLMALQKRLSRPRPGKLVYAFARVPEEEAANAGGKGQALAKLFQSGAPVPDGCILLPAAFAGDDLTAEGWSQVNEQLERLRRGKPIAFAVRSSALSEDSAQASFAGEFESVLDVRTDDEIRAAIREVRKSRESDRVSAYTQAQGMGEGQHSLAVIIQKLIQPDYAGVLFTVNPLTGNLSEMSGNFVTGLGDKLVSGQVSASQFTFDRPTGTYHGPAEMVKVAKALYQEANTIEYEMGGPQDIEWAAVGSKVFILQARPITTFNAYNPITAVWNDSMKGNFLWSATNLMEANPDVQTPFTASLRPYLDARHGPALTIRHYPLNGIIGGRFYVNISVQVTALARTFKGDTHRAYQELAGWWGRIPDEMDIPLVPVTKKEWEQDMTQNLWSTVLQFSKYRRQALKYAAQNPRKCVDLCAKIMQEANPARLAALWNKTIFPRYRDSVFFIVANSSYDQIKLEAELTGLVGAEDANALLSNLSQGSRLESMGPAMGLALVQRGEMTREAYLQAYGHRGEKELECAWPRPMEDPHWLDRQLTVWARNPVDVDALQARQRAAYDSAWARFSQQHPDQVKTMRKKISRVAKGAQLRELVRSESTRGLTVLRAFAIRAGELLGVGDDVFYLTIDEILSGLEKGECCAIQYIPLRKETYEKYRALPPYPAIICGRFDPFAWAANPNRRSDLVDLREPAATEPASSESTEASDHTIHGAAGALGVVEGSVRRLDSLSESEQFQPGEVLVTTMTNIGWTHIFPRAAAIVTDLGAPLSHAAIVARELGIPAVVGCGNATMRLKTGDRVRVNGGKGLVEILTSKN